MTKIIIFMKMSGVGGKREIHYNDNDDDIDWQFLTGLHDCA